MKNMGPPRNWNECVRRARGEFFALLPDDDAYLPGFLEQMIAGLRGYPNVGMVQCAFYLTDERFRSLMPVRASDSLLVLRGEEALIWELTKLLCPPASLMFRLSAMLEMGLWREDYWDDWAFIIRLAYRHGVAYIPTLLSCNRIHSQNLNRELTRGGRDSILDLINQQADVWREALPLSSKLIRFRSKLDRELSHHSVLRALSASRRGNWALARFHWRRARDLYALAGADPGFFKLWFELQKEGGTMRKRKNAAHASEPLLPFEASQ
jgi:GT2 family glycosyltransferase